ncbi:MULTISPECIES: LysR family transcriptional regulator [unclassified Duganella]|uniref:LysR family transcriptional regulator n=1 Tax=unclassified Duganella TaxID=2636909 RepID=UPI000701BDA9|nr:MULTISPECIES: LysR family transcriptional regulator [unclassified Duganella]KQV53985.1 transcriptional regulator [Duganella sp. Root336D2]KRB98197.1 transcriptional regulator [Duganella sp. Root198D2]
MSTFTLHDLQCFDAVARSGGFQPAAELLHRSHPAVHAAVTRLERQTGLQLLDRSGYRVTLTAAGKSFHRKAQATLTELSGLQVHAQQLAMGQEDELRVVIGDMCPQREVLATLAAFFRNRPATRLHVQVEAVTGPIERLYDGDADLIVHGVDQGDPRIEWMPLSRIPFVPVVAPGFLRFPASGAIKPVQLRGYTQCVIRDTARHTPGKDYFMVEGAHQCSVPDQQMKKEIILQGLAWGHLPRFLVERELEEGSLLSIAGRYLPGSVEELVAARRNDRPHGPVAQELWEFLSSSKSQPAGRS